MIRDTPFPMWAGSGLTSFSMTLLVST
jgi:hypothetical protein